MTRASLVAVLVAGLAAAGLDAQPSQHGSIMGRIEDSAGNPVRHAVVTLSGGLAQISLTVSMARALEGGPRRVLTDAEGRFVFADLAAGEYTVDASKAGYLPGAYGRRRHGGGSQTLTLAQNERRVGVRITMWEFVAITGTVVDEAGEPVVGVQVTAQRQGYIGTRPRLAAAAATAVTDDRGVYRIDGLPPGGYVLCVPTSLLSLPSGFADRFQEARTTAAASAAPAAVSDLLRQLSATDVRITSMDIGVGRQFGNVLLGTGARTPTLPPVLDGRQAAYQTTCYPNATPADAQRLTLEPGVDRTNIDLTLTPTPTAALSGVLQAPDGLVANIGVRLLPSYIASLANDLGAETAVAVTDATGAFHFPAVPHGQYTLRVLRAPTDMGPNNQSGAPAASTQATAWANMPVTISEEGISDLAVPLQTGFRVTGQLELDGTNKPAPELIEKFSIQFDPIDGSGSRMPAAYRGRIDRTGRITTNEIPPGRYVVLFLAFAQDRLAMPGWEAVGATINGRDVSHTPFDLTGDVNTLVMTLTDHASHIAGTVRDAQGNPDPGGAVLMYPTDPERWRNRGFSTRAMRLLRAGADGGYRLGSVPPGEYFVVALADEDAGDWENPEVLNAAARGATRVTITGYEKKTLDLVTTTLKGIGR